MQRQDLKGLSAYASSNAGRGFYLHARFRAGDPLAEKTEADLWLTERYCLYQETGEALYRYDIHHLPWELQQVRLEQLALCYRIGTLELDEKPPALLHYSPGVKVLAWNKVRVSSSY